MVYWKETVLASVLIHALVESYLEYRQLVALRNRNLPPRVKELFEQETVEKSLDYQQEKLKLKLARHGVELFVTVSFIIFNVHATFWDISGNISRLFVSHLTNDSVLQVLICLNIFRLVDTAFSFPFDWYDEFVIEEKYGFNKFTMKKFLSVISKSYVISTIFTGVFTIGLLKVVQFGKKILLFYATIFLILFYLLVLTVFPLIVHPWFYKLTPLKEGSLKTAITKLTDSQGFPANRIEVCDGSSMSSHSNAFFSGLPWAKHIVLFDTLVESHTDEEIVAVLGHELGHWKDNHIIKLSVSSIAVSLINIHLFSFIYKSPSFYMDFGFTNEYPFYIGYLLFEKLAELVNLFSNLLSNLRTRLFEYKADKFAADLGYSKQLADSLTKIKLDNLNATNTDWLYSIYSLSHPNLSERLEGLNTHDKNI